MVLSIVKYYSTLVMAQRFEKDSDDTFGTTWYKIHHLLMVFFLIGYVLVLLSLVGDIEIIGELFTSLIFFLALPSSSLAFSCKTSCFGLLNFSKINSLRKTPSSISFRMQIFSPLPISLRSGTLRQESILSEPPCMSGNWLYNSQPCLNTKTT